MDAMQNYDNLSSIEPESRSRAYTWHGPRIPDQLKMRSELKQVMFDPLDEPGCADSTLEGGEPWSETQPDSSKDDMNMKKPNSRRNAWGCMSYADLIARAIESVPERRLTLSQIYDWMIQNVPYFRDKGESSSSAGWKNSIRHNLSLHRRFTRVQNEGTGKSSWWIINEESTAPTSKNTRRRATSMDTRAMEKKRPRLKKKMEENSVNGILSEQYGSDVVSSGSGMFLEDGSPPYHIANTITHLPNISEGPAYLWGGEGVVGGLAEGGGILGGEGFGDSIYTGYGTGFYPASTTDIGGSAGIIYTMEEAKPYYEQLYSTQLTSLNNVKYFDCQGVVPPAVDLNCNDATVMQQGTPLPPASILLPLTTAPLSQTLNSDQPPLVISGNIHTLTQPYPSPVLDTFKLENAHQIDSSTLVNKITTQDQDGKGSVLRQMLASGPTGASIIGGGIFSNIRPSRPSTDVLSKYISTSSNGENLTDSRQYVKLETLTPISDCEEEKSRGLEVFGCSTILSARETEDVRYVDNLQSIGSNLFQYDLATPPFCNDFNPPVNVRESGIGYNHVNTIESPSTIGYSVYSTKASDNERVNSDMLSSSACKTTLNQVVAIESTEPSYSLELDQTGSTQNHVSSDFVIYKTEPNHESSSGVQLLDSKQSSTGEVREEDDCLPSSGMSEENWEFNLDLVPCTSVTSPVSVTSCHPITAESSVTTFTMSVATGQMESAVTSSEESKLKNRLNSYTDVSGNCSVNSDVISNIKTEAIELNQSDNVAINNDISLENNCNLRLIAPDNKAAHEPDSSKCQADTVPDSSKCKVDTVPDSSKCPVETNLNSSKCQVDTTDSSTNVSTLINSPDSIPVSKDSPACASIDSKADNTDSQAVSADNKAVRADSKSLVTDSQVTSVDSSDVA